MNLRELREPVRMNLVKNDIRLLDILATGHNLIQCINNKQWERLNKKTQEFTGNYNALISELNKKDTPSEDVIIELKARIEELKNE